MSRLTGKQALAGAHKEYFYTPDVDSKGDVDLAFGCYLPVAKNIIKREKKKIPRTHNLKIRLRMQVALEKWSFELNKSVKLSPWFPSEMFSLLREKSIGSVIKKAFATCLQTFDNFVQAGSGWQLVEVLSFNLVLSRYELFKGGCSLRALPQVLRKKKGLVILTNTDSNRCFLYAVISALLLEKKNMTRVKKVHKQLLSYFSSEFISYPVTC